MVMVVVVVDDGNTCYCSLADCSDRTLHRGASQDITHLTVREDTSVLNEFKYNNSIYIQ